MDKVSGSIKWFKDEPKKDSFIIFLIYDRLGYGRYVGNKIIIVADFDGYDSDRSFEDLDYIEKWAYFDNILEFV